MNTQPLGGITVDTALASGYSLVTSRPDPQSPGNQTFGRLALSALTAPAGSTVSAIEVPALHKTIAATLVSGSALALPLYQITDTADTSNLLLLAIQISYEDVIGSKFTYEIWAGNPTVSGSIRLAVAGQDIFFTQYNTLFSSSATAYLDNASLRVGLWINVINRLTSPLIFSAKLSFLKLPAVANPVTLPPYTATPFVYTGPSGLTVVDVGPGQTFPEMADALPFVAKPFTMNVHPGTYFKPIFLDTTYGGSVIQSAPGVTADQIVLNGRGGYLTGYPLWLNDDFSQDQINPFRLARGKAFILTNSPITVRRLGFWYCGGNYGRSQLAVKVDPAYPSIPVGSELNLGQGEAGIYAELFTSPGTITIDRCTFDGNANGVFVPLTYLVDSSGIKLSGPASGPGVNVDLVMTNCDFSSQVQNGANVDGLSHNVYVSGRSVTSTNCNFFGCNGNSFKSRSPSVTINGGTYQQGQGRAIDFPEGGTLTVTGARFTQWSRDPGVQIIHNFMSLAVENQNNGPALATFTNCRLEIGYLANFLCQGAGTSGTFTNPTIIWYATGLPSQIPSFEYDDVHTSLHGTIHGLGSGDLPYAPPNGATIVQGFPPQSALVHLT